MRYVILMIFLYSCFSSKEQQVKTTKFESIKFVLQEIGTVKKTSKEISIRFIIINKGSTPVYINNPGCWESSVPVINYNSNRISPIIKVKINPDCAKKLVHIGKGDTVSIKYNYFLDKLIDLNNLGKYELQFEYYGTVFNEKRERISSISDFTNKIFFNVAN